MNMIETRNLSRRFGKVRAISDLDLTVREGELYGFLGPNGAGKTTFIRMVSGLLEPTSGSIEVDGKNYKEHSREIRAITGLMPDTPVAYDFLTGRQYVGLVASLYGIDSKQRDEDAERLLEIFDLSHRADELTKGYSFGMKKKIVLTSVLVTRPKLLLLDEPTTGLDPASSRKLKDLLREYCEQGMTVMLSTHVLDTAERICDRVGILLEGALKAEGSMEELRSLGGQESLEDIFLQLTSEAEAEELDASAAQG